MSRLPPDPAPDEEPPPARGATQFRLGSLFTALFLFSVVAAVLGAIFRNQQSADAEPSPALVLLLVASPLAVMIVLSLVGRLAVWYFRRRG